MKTSRQLLLILLLEIQLLGWEKMLRRKTAIDRLQEGRKRRRDGSRIKEGSGGENSRC